MKISTLFSEKIVFSFEVFPPKRSSPIETIYNTLEELDSLMPDFISVTYGAGGSADKIPTVEIASVVKSKHKIEPVAHLPCINFSKDEILTALREFETNDVRNILALRGDIIPNSIPKTDFKYASDLVEFISQNGDFNIIGACYPEGHPESASIVEDIRNLKRKADSGVSHLISQLFFDNDIFYSFLERTKIAGINLPIQAGIMPVTNRKQIERMVTLCGVALPSKFSKIMERYGDKPDAMRDAGIAYAVDQIVDLVAQGIDGIHLYTMNNPLIAAKITQAVASLF